MNSTVSVRSEAGTVTGTQKEKYLDKVVPTLFIGVGGTGFEILARVRRRILSRIWNSGSQPILIDRLEDFPFAKFLHIDLNLDTGVESGRSTDDPLQAAISFKPNERYVKKLDLEKYIKDDEFLGSYPHIEEWFPLSAQKVSELNINPEKGAGQIRAISRLYFFDGYNAIKGAIRMALSNLRSNIDTAEQHKRLGLTTELGALRVVVVASTAGGTGSGAAIDIGFLSKALLKESGASATSTQLVLMLPTGYVGANADRTKANTYATLMELETCMRGGSSYVTRWSENENENNTLAIPRTPFDDVYFLDTENVAGSKTASVLACFDMAADVLFEDFSTAEFANWKRSIAVNQNQHKVLPFSSRIDRNKYGDLQLTFSRAYSAFGQAILDIQLEQKQSIAVERMVCRILGVFFVVSSELDRFGEAHPTETDRDEMLARLMLSNSEELVQYYFATNEERFFPGGQGRVRTIVPMVTELLRGDGRVRLDEIEKGIDEAFERVRNEVSFKELPNKLDGLLKQFRRDAIKTADVGTGMHEIAVERRRVELRRVLMDPSDENGVIRALWARVDNKEKGGLDFTIELIQRMKDRMCNAETGLANRLEQESRWFFDLSSFIANEEISTLKEHLSQAVNARFGFGNKQATHDKWLQLSQAVKAFVRYHLLAVACREAAGLIRDLSDDLGKQVGTDEKGNPVWQGFIGELERGRKLVLELITDSRYRIDLVREAMKQHETYLVLSARDDGADEPETMPHEDAQKWAMEVFKNFGGTQKLFALLEKDQGRIELIGKLRNQALDYISKANEKRGVNKKRNPLFDALDELSEQQRKELLALVVQRAMPWVALNLDGYLKEQTPQDQYKCLVGVKDSVNFKKLYGKILESAIPTISKMTANQVNFYEISEPGRLICYVELSGIPVPALRGLGDWYASYRQENKNLPVHTHKDVGKFLQVRELTSGELASRKNDLALMIQALALGVLMRSNKSNDNGALKLKIGGVLRAVGSEREIRLNGFDSVYRVKIEQLVQNELSLLQNAHQRAMWWFLMRYYKEKVYPIRVVREGTKDRHEKHLPTLVCEELENGARELLVQSLKKEQSLKEEDVDALSKLIDALSKLEEINLKSWTTEIPDSEKDPYEHEINQGSEDDPDSRPKPKRVLKPDVFDAGWRLTDGMAGIPASAPIHTSMYEQIPAPSVMPPQSSQGTPPPLNVPPLPANWFVGVGGQALGPFSITMLASMVRQGQVTPATLVWREGMLNWLAASAVPELAHLFLQQVPTKMPPPLPPQEGEPL